eukprot:scaffold73339_cov60-Phaeocystis_antarctica.AAC.10
MGRGCVRARDGGAGGGTRWMRSRGLGHRALVLAVGTAAAVAATAAAAAAAAAASTAAAPAAARSSVRLYGYLLP